MCALRCAAWARARARVCVWARPHLPLPPPPNAHSFVDMPRLKEQQEMVGEYQAFASVGGKKLWMTLETGVATTWVMSAACFTLGCKKTPLSTARKRLTPC